jgi:Protein of unknown function (DUF2971)
MALPPLYKYLDVQGARLTLGNNTFRHAKPSEFNDIEDMTIQSIFPEDTEVALKTLSEGFIDVILQHMNDRLTCGPKMAGIAAQLRAMFRARPDAVATLKEEIKKGPLAKFFNVDAMRTLSEAFVNWVNEFLQRYRVLCVTTQRDSEKMWSGYAEGHKGIVLRIEPNIAKGSKFELFRPVSYHEKRPPLYNDTLAFLEGCLFGDQAERAKQTLAKIIYSKTLKWQDECEYRLAIPLGEDEEPYETLKYDPEEITELYLGLAMDEKDKEDIIGKARALNPKIAIFQAKRDAKGNIVFDAV